MTTQVVTARLDEALLANLDRLATASERSRAWLVAKAVERFVRDELADADFLQAGDDDFAHADILDHEDFIASLRMRHRDAA